MNLPIDKIRSKKILVVGDLMLDVYLRGHASRISPEAPVPIVSAERRDLIPGGAANVMCNLQALGCSVTGAGFVGKDDEGKFLISALQAKNINTESIFSTELPTIHKTRVLANGHHIVRFDFDTDFTKVSGNQHLELVEYIETLVATHLFDAVVVSDYCKGTVTADVVAAVKQCVCPVIVDTKPRHKHYFDKVWCMTPNLDEAKQMVDNEDDLSIVAQTLKKEMSLQSIIITLADKGILLIDEDNKETLYEAYTSFDEHDSTQRFDVTGAGDTVISVLAACVSAGIKTTDAVYAANIAAGIVVNKIGTSACSYDELVHELSKESHDKRGFAQI